MAIRNEKLEPEKYYHIFNRSVGSELLFIDETDYSLFFRKFRNFILPVCDIITYCLLPNHFHLFVRIFDENTIQRNLRLKNQDQVPEHLNHSFSNFFNSYAKAFNLKHRRKGKLFMLPYKRINVEDPAYFISLINYLHRNPVHHGLVQYHSEWRYSSYNAYVSNIETKVNKELGLAFFGNVEEFIQFHAENNVKKGTKKYLIE